MKHVIRKIVILVLVIFMIVPNRFIKNVQKSSCGEYTSIIIAHRA